MYGGNFNSIVRYTADRGTQWNYISLAPNGFFARVTRFADAAFILFDRRFRIYYRRIIGIS